MNDMDFHNLQLKLFSAFNAQLQTAAKSPGGEMLVELAQQCDALHGDASALLDDGPALVSRMFTTAPQLVELFPRDLLWYLGGECLHFMPDEEIQSLGTLDEARRDADLRGEPFNWSEQHALARKLQ